MRRDGGGSVFRRFVGGTMLHYFVQRLGGDDADDFLDQVLVTHAHEDHLLDLCFLTVLIPSLAHVHRLHKVPDTEKEPVKALPHFLTAAEKLTPS